jgi:hypothetical protein
MGLGALAFVLGGVLGVSTSAQAAPGDLASPFDIGQGVCIYQGYDHGTHTGKSEYGLDLVANNCNSTSAAGMTVHAPAAGTVHWDAPYGDLCINIAGGRSITLTHINATVTSGSVSAGQVVGSIATAGSVNNNGVAHLHLQIWSSPGCYNSSVIPFDSAHGARICGAPDLTPSGPSSGNGTWSHTTFTASICGGSGSGTSGGWNGVGNATYIGSHLVANQIMYKNQYLESPNGRYVLMLQNDGNLVIYNGTQALWGSGTQGQTVDQVKMQDDGNLVMYGPQGQGIWGTNTAGHGTSTLYVQNDGNVVIYNSAGAFWSTNTAGRLS